jgi:hypothetical protein
MTPSLASLFEPLCGRAQVCCAAVLRTPCNVLMHKISSLLRNAGGYFHRMLRRSLMQSQPCYLLQRFHEQGWRKLHIVCTAILLGAVVCCSCSTLPAPSHMSPAVRAPCINHYCFSGKTTHQHMLSEVLMASREFKNGLRHNIECARIAVQAHNHKCATRPSHIIFTAA